jgi:hypothetical protein
MEALLYFGGTILATIVVTVLLCRYQLSHKKLIKFDTVFVGTLIANMIVFISFGFYEEGLALFTREVWTSGKGSFESGLVVLGVITIVCILPALGVAVYHERRSKRNEKHLV